MREIIKIKDIFFIIKKLDSDSFELGLKNIMFIFKDKKNKEWKLLLNDVYFVKKRWDINGNSYTRFSFSSKKEKINYVFYDCYDGKINDKDNTLYSIIPEKNSKLNLITLTKDDQTNFVDTIVFSYNNENNFSSVDLKSELKLYNVLTEVYERNNKN